MKGPVNYTVKLALEIEKLDAEIKKYRKNLKAMLSVLTHDEYTEWTKQVNNAKKAYFTDEESPDADAFNKDIRFDGIRRY